MCLLCQSFWEQSPVSGLALELTELCSRQSIEAGFEVLSVVPMIIVVVWEVTAFSLAIFFNKVSEKSDTCVF
jgi:hypothetical protein